MKTFFFSICTMSFFALGACNNDPNNDYNDNRSDSVIDRPYDYSYDRMDDDTTMYNNTDTERVGNRNPQ